jgi:somatostatin receptor 2
LFFQTNETEGDSCLNSNGTSNTSDLCNDDIFYGIGNITEHGHSEGLVFFTYFTPIIFIVGFVGNVLSLMVFVTKNMRKLSASVYLAALSTSDILALVFFVLIEWIKRGLREEFGNHIAIFLEANGVCQIIIFLTYVSRFLSTWLVACFTLERYIGICHPLKRRDICDINSSKKIVMATILISIFVSAFRPWLNEVRHIGPNKIPWCIRQPEYVTLSFIYDCIFAVCITFLPFFIITTLNILIIRTLIKRNKRQKKCNVITEESIIRFEFTVILITISFCFIAFNTPYAVVWFQHFLQIRSNNVSLVSRLEISQNMYFFTKTIFFMNYCINFFLYSMTGAYFRKELKVLFTYGRKIHESYHRCSVQNSHQSTSTPNSVV